MTTDAGRSPSLDDLDLDALYEVARALADRGEDHGADVYGGRPEHANTDDPAAGAAWARAFEAATAAYHRAAGIRWTY